MTRRTLTPTSLLTTSVTEVIRTLYRDIMTDIPEGIKDDTDLKQIEHFLGRLANDYAYVVELLSYSRHYVRYFKRQGAEAKQKYEDMMDIRDALESIASAIKLRYEAVSRMLTAMEQRLREKDMVPYRKGLTNEHNRLS